MRYLRSTWQATKFLRREPLGESGSVLVEFAVVLPLLLLLLIGAVVFGLAMINYGIVTQVAGVGARELAISRGDPKPYTDTVYVIKTAATTNLNAKSLTYTLSVGGTECASDGTCSSLLGDITLTASPPPEAMVTVTYPCDPIGLAPTLKALGVDFGACTLTATMAEAIQ